MNSSEPIIPDALLLVEGIAGGGGTANAMAARVDTGGATGGTAAGGVPGTAKGGAVIGFGRLVAGETGTLTSEDGLGS